MPFLNILNVIFDRFNWIKIETLKRKEITPHKTIYLYLFVFIEIYIFIYLSNKSEAMASIVADMIKITTEGSEPPYFEDLIKTNNICNGIGPTLPRCCHNINYAQKHVNLLK